MPHKKSNYKQDKSCCANGAEKKKKLRRRLDFEAPAALRDQEPQPAGSPAVHQEVNAKCAKPAVQSDQQSVRAVQRAVLCRNVSTENEVNLPEAK